MIDFVKYHGTGNDFILIDARAEDFPHDKFTTGMIASLCERRFGIGADGLILMKEAIELDFYMDYYNSDGNPSSMCGNGSRCAMMFARELGLIENHADFLAPDGQHEAHFEGDHVAVKMNTGDAKVLSSGDWYVDTGSPHYVRKVSRVGDVAVVEEGRKVRNSAEYKEEGVNVNFLEQKESGIKVATYERGVENETFSCGTGVTACALVDLAIRGEASGRVQVDTRGGRLDVDIGVLGVWLIGPAVKVFVGQFPLDV